MLRVVTSVSPAFLAAHARPERRRAFRAALLVGCMLAAFALQGCAGQAPLRTYAVAQSGVLAALRAADTYIVALPPGDPERARLARLAQRTTEAFDVAEAARTQGAVAAAEAALADLTAELAAARAKEPVR